MQLGIPHTCDVNVPLQRRLHEDMDTCAFTALERVGPTPSMRESDATPAPDEQRGPVRRRSEQEQSPHLALAAASEGLPTWAVVLALAVALAAVAYFNKKKKK
jgi:hypothetical protein